jgi:hypothetical protein
MSSGRLFSKRSRAVSYYVGQKPAPRKWRQKRVGWFGKFLAVTLVGAFFCFGFGARTALFASFQPNVQFSAKQASAVSNTAAQTATAPPLANGIVNLQPVLDKWEQNHAGQHWSVAVKSLDGPVFGAALHGDDTYTIDGAYRLFLVLPLFAQMPLEKQQQTLVTINGNQRVLSKCVDLMLRISDTNCGQAVGKYVTLSRANALFKQDGFAHTTFKQSTTAVETTANDTAQYLIALNGSSLSQSGQALVMGALQNQIFRSGIPAACPGCQMADYSGFSGSSVYDAAVATYSRGKYVISIYSDQETTGFADISKLAGQIQQRILDSFR